MLLHRIRTLDADALGVLLDHERAHANRVQVVRMMEHRLDALRNAVDLFRL